MQVVEVGGVLIVEEEAEVAVTPGSLGGLDPGGENEGADDPVLEQRDAVRAAERRAIAGDPEKFEDLVAVDVREFLSSVVSQALASFEIPGKHWFFLCEEAGGENGEEGRLRMVLILRLPLRM